MSFLHDTRVYRKGKDIKTAEKVERRKKKVTNYYITYSTHFSLLALKLFLLSRVLIDSFVNRNVKSVKFSAASFVLFVHKSFKLSLTALKIKVVSFVVNFVVNFENFFWQFLLNQSFSLLWNCSFLWKGFKLSLILNWSRTMKNGEFCG